MLAGSVSVGSTATLVVNANNLRGAIAIVNNSSVTIYIGPSTSVTTANGIPILPSGNMTVGGYAEVWRGAVYAIVATGSADLRYWEWEK